MTKNSIFLFLCIYNLEYLTYMYNQMKLFIEILTRSPIILAIFLSLAWPPLIKLGNARDWLEAGRDAIQSNQTQINMAMHFSKKCDF